MVFKEVVKLGIRISTGLVRAAGYADKLRRVLIAATKGKASPEEAVKIASYINQHLFKIFRENNVEKSDVVRIFLNIDIIDGKILIDWNSLSIEVYKPYQEFEAKEVGLELPEAREVTEEEVKAALEEKERPEEEGAEYIEHVEVKEKKIPEKKEGILEKLKRAFKKLFGE